MPKDESKMNKCAGFDVRIFFIELPKLLICEKHWPENTEIIKLP